MKKTGKGLADAAKTGKPAKTARFLHKPSCTTCRKARSYMEKRSFQLEFRDLGKDRLNAKEIEQLIGDRDHKDFLNTRNELYRSKKMKDNPPSRKEAIRMMAEEPNLIRRPVVLAGGRIVLGFDEKGLSEL